LQSGEFFRCRTAPQPSCVLCRIELIRHRLYEYIAAAITTFPRTRNCFTGAPRTRALASPAIGHWGTCTPDLQVTTVYFFWSLQSCTKLGIQLHVVSYPVKYTDFVAVYCMCLMCATIKLFSLSFVECGPMHPLGCGLNQGQGQGQVSCPSWHQVLASTPLPRRKTMWKTGERRR